MIKVLFIDDDSEAQKTLSILLGGVFSLIPCVEAEGAKELVTSEKPDVVLLDIDFPNADGFDILKLITDIPLAPPVIMLTGFSNPKFVVKAMQLGAHNYLVKPFDLDDIKRAVREALESRMTRDNSKSDSSNHYLDNLIGDSDHIDRVKQLAISASQSSLPVLISGESGTGKELVARAIHSGSSRSGMPFVAMNCGAIPETLIETEIFGCEKGAFTDAVSRAGCFERAQGGTLFLDEIGEMPLGAQVKFLRILEEQELRRVGGTKIIQTDVRLVVATNKKLKKMVREGGFREDLYYRINIIPISIPPLRERKQDIPSIVLFFLESCGYSREKFFTQGALRKMMQYSWPGNVRELKNVVSRAVIFSHGKYVYPQDIDFE